MSPQPTQHDLPAGPEDPRPATFLDRVERVLLRVILVAVLVLALLLGFASWHTRQQRAAAAAQAAGANVATMVSLAIDYGDGVRKTFTDLPASPGMTVLDVMNAGKSHARPITFTATGSGETTLLDSIDDLPNEGANKRPSRCWQYWIDSSYGMSSIAVAKVNAGQRVSWAFRPYESDPKPPAP